MTTKNANLTSMQRVLKSTEKCSGEKLTMQRNDPLSLYLKGVHLVMDSKEKKHDTCRVAICCTNKDGHLQWTQMTKRGPLQEKEHEFDLFCLIESINF